MAFTYTRTVSSMNRNKRIYGGTYTNTSGSTGGEIVTGLKRIDFFSTNDNAQQATTTAVSISGGTVTITTVADVDGQWEAVGV